ncbi:hypothetical protein [Hydrogenophaga sp.]|uniref:hypothetical protein n=1 Tax=Hydrogenophaga sp. TaxID=1904254 RepID=UPI003F70CA74
MKTGLRGVILAIALMPGGVSAQLEPLPGRGAQAALSDARRAIVQDLLNAYSNDLNAISRVADHADFGLLAWAVYEEAGSPAMMAANERGWRQLGSRIVIENAATGDTVAALFAKRGQRPVLAFRGSATSLDWVTNTVGSIATDPLLTAQLRAARLIAEEVVLTHPDVVFAGHSLGGRLAQAARLSTGNPAVVFNSAPLGVDDRVRALLSIRARLSPLQHFRSPEDPLTAWTSAEETVIGNIQRTGLSVAGNTVAGFHTHNIQVLASAMLNVESARREGWIDAYLRGSQTSSSEAPPLSPPASRVRNAMGSHPWDFLKPSPALMDLRALARSGDRSLIPDLRESLGHYWLHYNMTQIQGVLQLLNWVDDGRWREFGYWYAPGSWPESRRLGYDMDRKRGLIGGSRKAVVDEHSEDPASIDQLFSILGPLNMQRVLNRRYRWLQVQRVVVLSPQELVWQAAVRPASEGEPLAHAELVFRATGDTERAWVLNRVQNLRLTDSSGAAHPSTSSPTRR